MATSSQDRAQTPPARRARSPSPPTPEPGVPRWDADEQDELTQLVIKHHGGGNFESMMERSLVGQVNGGDLATSSSTYARHRKEAIRFLVEQFEEVHLRDEWLVATIGLIDRVAALKRPLGRTLSRTASRSSSRDTRTLSRLGSLTGVLEGDSLAQMLAAALCVLKLGTAEAELDCCMKELIFKLAGRKRRDAELWRQVYEAELHMYRLLDFQVAVPSVADLNSRIGLDIVAAAETSPEGAQWKGMELGRLQSHKEKPRTPRFVALSAFLIELGLAHAPEHVYGDCPPVALALAAAKLALHAFGAPPAACHDAYVLIEREAFDCEQPAKLLTSLTVALYKSWKSPPNDCKVTSKWKMRQDRQLLVLPPPPENVPFLPVEVPLCTPQRPTRPRSPCPSPITEPRPPMPSSSAGQAVASEIAAKANDKLLEGGSSQAAGSSSTTASREDSFMGVEEPSRPIASSCDLDADLPVETSPNSIIEKSEEKSAGEFVRCECTQMMNHSESVETEVLQKLQLPCHDGKHLPSVADTPANVPIANARETLVVEDKTQKTFVGQSRAQTKKALEMLRQTKADCRSFTYQAIKSEKQITSQISATNCQPKSVCSTQDTTSRKEKACSRKSSSIKGFESYEQAGGRPDHSQVAKKRKSSSQCPAQEQVQSLVSADAPLLKHIRRRSPSKTSLPKTALERFSGKHDVYVRLDGKMSLFGEAVVSASGCQVIKMKTGRPIYEQMTIVGDGINSPFLIKARDTKGKDFELQLTSELVRQEPPYRSTVVWRSETGADGKRAAAWWIQKSETPFPERLERSLHAYSVDKRPSDDCTHDHEYKYEFSTLSSKRKDSISPSTSPECDSLLLGESCIVPVKRKLVSAPSSPSGADENTNKVAKCEQPQHCPSEKKSDTLAMKAFRSSNVGARST